MRRLLPILSLVLATWAPSIAAEPLAARDAARRALAQSPELVPVRMSARRATEIARRADATPPLPLVVGLGAGARRNAGSDTAPEVVVSVSQPLRLASLSDSRSAHAAQVAELSRAAQAQQELDVSQEVLSQWVELRHWQQVEELWQAAVERAEQLQSLVVAQVEVGAVEPGDDALAQSNLGRQRVRLLTASVERDRALASLRLLLGAPLAELTAAGELQLIDVAADDMHPAVQSLWARARTKRAGAELELVEARPTMGLGVSVTREGTGDWLMLGQVSLPLPFGNSASYSSAQNARDVEALEFEAEHLEERMQFLARDLRRQLAIRARMVEQARNEELEPARRAAMLIEHKFRAGKVALNALLLARDRIFEAELNQLEVQRELALAQIQLAWAEGWLVHWVRTEP